VRPLADDVAKLRRLTAELLLGCSLETCVVLVDLVDDRLDAAPFALVAGPEDLAQYAFPYLSVQPVRADILGDGIGDEPTNRPTRANTFPNLRR
jgi:hypothetical protein